MNIHLVRVIVIRIKSCYSIAVIVPFAWTWTAAFLGLSPLLGSGLEDTIPSVKVVLCHCKRLWECSLVVAMTCCILSTKAFLPCVIVTCPGGGMRHKWAVVESDKHNAISKDHPAAECTNASAMANSITQCFWGDGVETSKIPYLCLMEYHSCCCVCTCRCILKQSIIPGTITNQARTCDIYHVLSCLCHT